MTENEVIKRLNTLNDALNEQCFDADGNSEALQDAIEAIEEVQQYRAIGKVEELRRLIDATSLKDRASEYAFSEDEYKRFCAIIDAEPTAYNPDKVVEQLKEASYTETQDDMNPCDPSEVINLESAIEIVRGGGVDA